MTWKPKKTNGRPRWRYYLTPAEREAIRAIDEAKARWEKLNADRAAIVNRACRRAAIAEGGK